MAVIPAATVAGAQVPVLSYVRPVSGQGPETNALGVPPTGPNVDAASTATDNDGSASITVG